MNAPELLQKAADIMTERGKQYDKPEGERSMGKCVQAFNTITGQNLTEAEGWLLLQILKDVRQWQRPGYHQDSAEDCIAYAALKAEAKQHEQVTESVFIPAFLAKKSVPNPIQDSCRPKPINELNTVWQLQNCPSCGLEVPNHDSGCSAISDSYGSQA
jgi:hypothetical protein